jgi:hypothetical protein
MHKEPKATARRDDPAQSRAFIEKAREIEADEERSRAVELLGRLAEKKPDPHQGKK